MVDRGLASSRRAAQAMIMAGLVSSDDRILDKPGVQLRDDIEMQVKAQSRYVSRAGDKLASVAHDLEIDFSDQIVLDVGSSTGGFTDYALQHGAARVYAVDVGTAQLAYKLRQDERVISLEQTDIRNAELPEMTDMAVIDVSFISLTKILEAVAVLVNDGGFIVAMAKPQFEAGKALADRYRGVIPQGEVRDAILGQLETWFDEHGFRVLGRADSAIAGAHGNVERFYTLKRNSTTSPSVMM